MPARWLTSHERDVATPVPKLPSTHAATSQREALRVTTHGVRRPRIIALKTSRRHAGDAPYGPSCPEHNTSRGRIEPCRVERGHGEEPLIGCRSGVNAIGAVDIRNRSAWGYARPRRCERATGTQRALADRRGIALTYGFAQTPFGLLRVARTDRGIAMIDFVERAEQLIHVQTSRGARSDFRRADGSGARRRGWKRARR